jgi:hypothetical protein
MRSWWKPLSTQYFFGRPNWQCWQHHLVQPVLRGLVHWQLADLHLHRHAPPGGRGQRAEVEGPGALALGNAVAEHVVVGMHRQPARQALVDLAPVVVGPCRARVLGPGEARRRRGIHEFPEAQGTTIGIDREQRMQEGRAGAALAGGEDGLLDHLPEMG